MIESKTQLAKLLATEDIIVRHSTLAKTASFDIKSRVLTLPNWSMADNDVVDISNFNVLFDSWKSRKGRRDYCLHCQRS